VQLSGILGLFVIAIRSYLRGVVLSYQYYTGTGAKCSFGPMTSGAETCGDCTGWRVDRRIDLVFSVCLHIGACASSRVPVLEIESTLHEYDSVALGPLQPSSLMSIGSLQRSHLTTFYVPNRKQSTPHIQLSGVLGFYAVVKKRIVRHLWASPSR